MWSSTFNPAGLTGQLIKRYTIGDCMLLSWTDYARSKKKAKLTNNKGKQNKPKQIKCENESLYKELIVDKTRAISRAIAVLFIYFFKFFFLQGFCWRKRFCWRVKTLGHSILVTKAKGTFVQVWARNVLRCTFLFVTETSYVSVYYCHVADAGRQVGSCPSLERIFSVFRSP